MSEAAFAPVYFDHNATTPLDPAVWKAMLPWLSERFGNPSSRHEYGRDARRAVDAAREKVAGAVGAQAAEIVFASSGSEANNLFIKGAVERMKPGLLAVSAIEHRCVIRPAEQLVRRGWLLEKFPVSADGRIDFEAYSEIVERKPASVSVMAANNETGVLQDIRPLAERSRSAGSLFHTDAAQWFGKLSLDFRDLNASGVNAMTLSAHKLGGPKGAAALVVDKRVGIEPLIAGGGHERGLRAGTENVAAIVGFGEACERVASALFGTAEKIRALRRPLERGLIELGAHIFGRDAERLPNTVCFSIPGIEGETLASKLDRAGYAVSSGSACSAENPEPSHVLLAMGVSPDRARGAVRVSLGASNTAGEVEGFLGALRDSLSNLMKLTAVAVR
ncbi:MAG: cysteine desulfurase [Candidatus Accumulibacter sp.]|jgi:cysteine desulfurase|nr:cysteine desulfurase [Accumulibacter sp.]